MPAARASCSPAEGFLQPLHQHAEGKIGFSQTVPLLKPSAYTAGKRPSAGTNAAAGSAATRGQESSSGLTPGDPLCCYRPAAGGRGRAAAAAGAPAARPRRLPSPLARPCPAGSGQRGRRARPPPPGHRVAARTERPVPPKALGQKNRVPPGAAAHPGAASSAAGALAG